MLIAIIVLLSITNIVLILMMFMMAAIVSNTKKQRFDRIKSDLLRILLSESDKKVHSEE